MRNWIGAALLAGALGLLTSTGALASGVASRAATQVAQDRAITDISARHRGRAHAQRSVRSRKYRHGYRHRGIARAPGYAEQPYGSRPDGMAPFFPFGFGGYGFQPSW